MSGVQASDARRTSRHAPPSPVPVVDAMSSGLLGFVIDVSAGGMKLMAAKPLVNNALYQLQFELPLERGGHVPIEAGVQVVSQRSNAGGGAVTGLRFIHLQGPQARQLREWLLTRAA